MATTELLGVLGMTAELKTYYSKKLLDRLVPALVHAEHGLQEDLGPQEGKSIEKRRFESFAAQLTALVEGTPPASINGTYTAITFTVSQYGAYMLVSDVMWQNLFTTLYGNIHSKISFNRLGTLEWQQGATEMERDRLSKETPIWYNNRMKRQSDLIGIRTMRVQQKCLNLV